MGGLRPITLRPGLRGHDVLPVQPLQPVCTLVEVDSLGALGIGMDQAVPPTASPNATLGVVFLCPGLRLVQTQ